MKSLLHEMWPCQMLQLGTVIKRDGKLWSVAQHAHLEWDKWPPEDVCFWTPPVGRDTVLSSCPLHEDGRKGRRQGWEINILLLVP